MGREPLRRRRPGWGLTNIITAMAGAYLEGRELLVIGGQVKVAEPARGEVRGCAAFRRWMASILRGL